MMILVIILPIDQPLPAAQEESRDALHSTFHDRVNPSFLSNIERKKGFKRTLYNSLKKNQWCFRDS
jgi:hypothetical protein